MVVAKKKEAEPLIASVDQTKAMAVVKAIEKEAEQIVGEFDKDKPVALSTPESYTFAGDVLIGIVERRKYVEEQREGFLEDVRKMVARVESWFTPVLETIGKAEEHYRKQMENYVRGLDVEAESLRKTAALTKDEDRAVQLLEQAKECAPPKVPGIGIRRPTRVIVIDEKKIPKKFFKTVVDAKKLAAALASGEKVAGAQLVVDVGLTVTPKNAKKDED